jgi:activator of HSP90 ATPase
VIALTEELELTATIPASAKKIYEAWLDSKGHTAMTGSEAKVDARIDGVFTAWEGYIEGTTIELEPNQRIVQNWRTSDFPSDSPDSKIEVILEEDEKGTKITLIHTGIPTGQADEYRKGWDEFYFSPMTRYFRSS